jgi:hypothetical protein
MAETGFSINHSKASNRYDAPDGTYETVIEQAAWAKTFSGKDYIKLTLVIRSDVTQPEQGETIEYPLWRSRPENIKPSDIAGVPGWKINQISKCVGLSDGEHVDSIEAWFGLLELKPLRVTVKQDDEGRAKVTRVEESQFPHVAANFVPVDDEDTPF